MAALVLLLAILGIYVGATLPPPAVVLTTPIPPTIRFGGYHIHTNRSDGAWSVDEVAAAAARAGLHFIILTDHGDATRAPDPPAYRHGVLVIDAVEISTADGHVVALNLEKPSPYPLAGRARDVIEDIHRLGGWAVVAHPDSPKTDLRWRAWDTAYDGVEWINADSEWRDVSKLRLAASALRATVRGPETIAALFTRPDVTISRWTGDLQRRPVIALGAMDAHGSFPFGNAVLRTVWQAVELDAAFSGQAGDDARKVLDAMHRGRTFTIIPAIASPAVLDFTATQSASTIHPGEKLRSLTEPVTFRGSVQDAADAQIQLVLNDGPFAGAKGSLSFDKGGVGSYKGSVSYEAMPQPGVTYRIEATFGSAEPLGDVGKPYVHVGPLHRPLPWIFSNPIYVGVEAPPIEAEPRPGAPSLERVAVPVNGRWGIEHAVGSSGDVAVDGNDLRFTFGLGSEAARNPYVALVAEVAGSTRLHRIEFTARADKPTRVSVQMRVPYPDFRDGLRWRRSVYLDETPRSIALDLLDFDRPFEGTTRIQDNAHDIRSLLFVADTLNTAPGARGTVWISKVAMGFRR